MNNGRLSLAVVAAVAVVFCCIGTAQAQDTAIYVFMPDQCARPCETIHIPVRVMNLQRTIVGYDISYVLDRPNVIVFSEPNLVDAQGTSTQDWELTDGSTFGGTYIRAVGIADLVTVPGNPPGLPPQVAFYSLVDLIAQVPCNPDTLFGSNSVRLDPTLTFYFSDPGGQLIEPVSKWPGHVTIFGNALGDIDGSGQYNVVDVVGLINCAFRGNCSVCSDRYADLDCDHDVDIIDVVLLVNYVFRGGPAPACS